jgi:hypothetical protein
MGIQGGRFEVGRIVGRIFETLPVVVWPVEESN